MRDEPENPISTMNKEPSETNLTVVVILSILLAISVVTVIIPSSPPSTRDDSVVDSYSPSPLSSSDQIWLFLFFVLTVEGLAFLLHRIDLLLEASRKFFGSSPDSFLTLCLLPILLPVWLVDRIALRSKSIHIRCPNCKDSDEYGPLRPTVVCLCGKEHDNLILDARGLFSRRCSCGRKLATTFLGGRGAYAALCPQCNARLVSTNSRQYGIQLVGGRGSGKTTFLAAFWSQYKEILEKQGVLYAEKPREQFATLEKIVHEKIVEPTTELNAKALSVVHYYGQESVQASFYDVSGKIFETGKSEIPQLQFGYCEGVLLFLDPCAPPDEALLTTTNFINAFNVMRGGRPSDLSKVPVAVVVPKADLFPEEFRSIQFDKTKLRENAKICLSFLAGRGFLKTINVIDAEFSNVAYFPVVSRNSEGKSYGVLQPVAWLMSEKASPFRDAKRNVFQNTPFNMLENA